MHSDPDLAHRLDAIESRLVSLERIVNNLVSYAARGSSAPTPPPIRQSAPPISDAKRRAFAHVTDPHQTATGEHDQPTPATPKARPAIEQFIGMRAFAYAGALVVIFAIALFLKLAYASGWLKLLSPDVRCISAASLGAILLLVAELTRRRFNDIAAAGLNLAGLGSIYASAYAAAAMFQLLSPPNALIALALTAVLGIVIGVRARLPLVSILASLAGYAAPLLLHDSLETPRTIPVYLVALLLASLAVASTKPRAYVPLRHIAATGTMLLGAVWARQQDAAHLPHVLVFLSVVWAALHADAARFSLRNDKRDLITPLLAALVSTAWATVMGLNGIRHAALPEPLISNWHWPAFLAACSLLFALPLGRAADALRNPFRDARARLAAICWTQALTLAVLAVALWTRDWPRDAAWLALALSLTLAARLLRARLLEACALAVLILVSCASLLGPYDIRPDALWDILGFHINLYTLISLASAAVLILFAVLARVDHALSRALSITASMFALPVVAAALAITDKNTDGQHVTLLWLALAAITALAHRAVPRLHLRVSALFWLLPTLLVWLVEANPTPWFDSRAPIFAHPALYSGFAIASLAAILSRAFYRQHLARPARDNRPILGGAIILSALAGALAAGLAFTITSAEIARAASILTDDPLTRAAAVSLYWAVLAVALIALGFRARTPFVRHVGLALMAVTATKAIVIDASLTADWARIIAILTIGLLMLAVALAYARLHARASRST